MGGAAAEQPPLTDWVVNLGTNDALDDNTAWRSSFEQMLAVTSSARCVVLVTINTAADALKGYPDDHVVTGEKALIGPLAQSYPSHRLWIDWSTRASASSASWPSATAWPSAPALHLERSVVQSGLCAKNRTTAASPSSSGVQGCQPSCMAARAGSRLE